jgi:deazaflavin-dependent oxidoreductase (nitroreductase family)
MDATPQPPDRPATDPGAGGPAGPATPPVAGRSAAAAHYREPGWFTRNVFNRLIRRLARMGISILGSRELRVRGRTTGEWRSTPVNLLVVDGQRYLVAPRGEAQWVRNVRVAGGGELRVGRHVEPFTVTEVAEADKPTVLRPYLQRWKFEVGAFFDGVDASASDEELTAIGPRHPVFLLGEASAA